MPRLKREVFLRPTRMVHRFGERDDPLMPFSDQQTFDMGYVDYPKSKNRPQAGPFNSKTKGLHVNVEPFSGVDKHRGGKASFSGPNPDWPDVYGNPVPVSTEMRRTQGAVPKSEKDEKIGKGRKRG